MKRILNSFINVLISILALIGALEVGTWLAHLFDKPAISTIALILV